MTPRRTFISACVKMSTTLMATRWFSPSQDMGAHAQTQTPAPASSGQRLTNWSGNLTYATDSLSYPRSADDVVRLVKQHDRLRALGTRHCFNTIADSPDHLMSLKDMNHVIALEPQARTVTVEGGINYGQLLPVAAGKGIRAP